MARLLMAMLAGLELQKAMEPDAPLASLVEPFQAFLDAHPDPDPAPGTD